MAKIQTIQLQNFKFFGETEPIQIGGKHVLLYGENGSGKSSLYTALRLLLNSTSMDEIRIKELFNKTHDDSLVNLYAPITTVATGDAGAFIEIVLDDATQTKYRISFDDADITAMQVAGRKESHLASDFIDYKFIFKTHLFAKGEIDLFEIFEEEILPYIQFDSVVTYYEYTGGIPSSKSSKSPYEIWKVLKNENNQVQDLLGVYPLTQKIGYINYEDNYNAFKTNIEILLADIQSKANKILETLGYDIKIDITPAFTKFAMTKAKLTLPKVKIPLKISNYYDMTDAVKKPHEFLNEAKLTAIALAIRLAFLEKRLQSAEVKILVLDDLMVSLDMSNRERVMDLIINDYLTRYQVFMFTHDMGLFEEMRAFLEYHYRQIAIKLGSSDKEADEAYLKEWALFDMYESYHNFPIPFISSYKDDLQKAYYYFKTNVDYKACGNYLRKAFEGFIRNYLPKRYFIDGNGEPLSSKELDLGKLMSKLKDYNSKIGFDSKPIEDLDRYKFRILNPTSHFSPKINIFKSEIKDCFEIFNKIKSNKNHPILVANNKIKFTINNASGVSYKYTAILLDDICLYQKNDGSASFYHDEDKRCYLMVEYQKGTSKTEKLDHLVDCSSLLELYDETFEGLSKRDATVIPEIDMYKVFTDEHGNSLNSLKRY